MSEGWKKLALALGLFTTLGGEAKAEPGTFMSEQDKQAERVRKSFEKSGAPKSTYSPGEISPRADKLVVNKNEVHLIGLVKEFRGMPLEALTIDDGPAGKYTPQILDILRDSKVKATFYLVGEDIEKFPKIVQRMAAEGHTIGIHCWKHEKINKKDGKLSPEDAYNIHFAQSNEALKRVIGKGTNLYRPAEGSIDKDQLKYFAEAGVYTANWSIDTEDWRQPKKKADEIVKSATDRVVRGGIILIHSSGGSTRKYTVEALSEMLKKLREKSVLFADVSEILGLKPLDENYFKQQQELIQNNKKEADAKILEEIARKQYEPLPVTMVGSVPEDGKPIAPKIQTENTPIAESTPIMPESKPAIIPPSPEQSKTVSSAAPKIEESVEKNVAPPLLIKEDSPSPAIAPQRFETPNTPEPVMPVVEKKEKISQEDKARAILGYFSEMWPEFRDRNSPLVLDQMTSAENTKVAIESILDLGKVFSQVAGRAIDAAEKGQVKKTLFASGETDEWGGAMSSLEMYGFPTKGWEKIDEWIGGFAVMDQKTFGVDGPRQLVRIKSEIDGLLSMDSKIALVAEKKQDQKPTNVVPEVLNQEAGKTTLPEGFFGFDEDGQPYAYDKQNKYKFLESDPGYKDLMAIAGKDTSGKNVEIKLRPQALKAWQQLAADFQKTTAGTALGEVGLYATEGYRDWKTQERYRKEKGVEAAVPGFSDHQLGTTVDIRKANRMELYKWLTEYDKALSDDNCIPRIIKAGFVPTVKREPWHWRYIGEKNAVQFYRKHKHKFLEDHYQRLREGLE